MVTPQDISSHEVTNISLEGPLPADQQTKAPYDWDRVTPWPTKVELKPPHAFMLRNELAMACEAEVLHQADSWPEAAL